MIASTIRSNHHHHQLFCLNPYFCAFDIFLLYLWILNKMVQIRHIHPSVPIDWIASHHHQWLFCRSPYLCPNTLPPLFWLHVEVLHEDTLALPGGVGEEEKGKANELEKLSFRNNFFAEIYLSLLLSHLAVKILVRSKSIFFKLLCADLRSVGHLLVICQFLDQAPDLRRIQGFPKDWYG